MPAETDVLARIRALLQAENNRDAASAAALFSPDALFTSGTREVQGRHAIEQDYRAFFGAFPDAASKLVTIQVHDSSAAVVETVLTATHLGDWVPPGSQTLFRPTGRPVRLQRVQVLHLNPSGEIAGYRLNADTYSVLEQIKAVPTTSLTRERLLAVLEQITDAWNRHDLDAIAACYAPDGTAEFSGGPPAVGREAIANAIRFWFTAFPDLKLITEEALTEGNRLIQVWTVRGTHTGPLGPIEPIDPKGRPLMVRGIAFMDVNESGLITSSRDIFDRSQLFRSVGVVPQ